MDYDDIGHAVGVVVTAAAFEWSSKNNNGGSEIFIPNNNQSCSLETHHFGPGSYYQGGQIPWPRCDYLVASQRL